MRMADAAADRRSAQTRAQEVHDRRVRHDDPALFLLTDELWAIAWHAARHTAAIPRESLRADVVAAWAIRDFLQRDLDRLSLALIRMAHDKAGMSYSELAAVMGKSGRQAVETYRRRLESAVAGGVKSERGSREQGQHHRQLTRAGRSQQLHGLIDELLAQREQLEALGIDLDEIAESAGAGGQVSDGVVAWLRLAIRELRGCQDEDLGALAQRGAQILDL